MATLLSGLSSFFILVYLVVDCRRSVNTSAEMPGTASDLRNIGDPWYATELVVNIWFLVEFLLGLTCTPDKVKFVPHTSISTIIYLSYHTPPSYPKWVTKRKLSQIAYSKEEEML